jgi:hypothetical protein
MEISLEGTDFSRTRTLVLINSNPQTITVRGVYDNLIEGPQSGIIQHRVTASSDNINYPVNLIGQPVSVTISDAQIPPVIGIDFDEVASTSTPVLWTKVTDIRNQSLMNLSLDDGTATGIDLTTTVDLCGIGGCGFGSGSFTIPQHTQPLDGLGGVVYARGTVTFTWSGLKPNAPYLVFLFGLGVFGPMNQSVSIAGNGSPVIFNQVANAGTLYINGVPSSTDRLKDFGQKIISSPAGTILITVTSNLGNNEMSFAGLGIREGTNCPETVVLDNIPLPNGLNHAAVSISSKGTVQNGTNVTFIAGNFIEMMADVVQQFQVENGGVLEAKIGGCP